jgi:hypothetical protein
LKKEPELNRDEFRKALFDVVECLTNHPLMDTGKKLVIHYFNESRERTSFEKAIWAINKYYPESIPDASERSKLLNRLLEHLREEADIWDSE